MRLFILGFHFKYKYGDPTTSQTFSLFIAMTFVFGLLDTSVDVWGHLGGLVGGLD